MRTEPLPSEQEKYNARLNRVSGGLPRLPSARCLWSLQSSRCPMLLLRLLWPNRKFYARWPSVGIAVLVTPNTALAYGDLPAGAQLSFHGRTSLPSKKSSLRRLQTVAP